MFPLYSDRKLSHFPFVSITLIIINCVVFWYQLTAEGSIRQSVWQFGVIPYEVFHPGAVHIAGRTPMAFSFVTGMFTHGGFIHLGSNMLYLWVFGRDVEDDFGHGTFLLFYIVSGILSTLVFVSAFPDTRIPLVGASGAIAGILGAYFLRFPLTKVYTLFIFIIIVRIIPIPAFLMLGFWFVIQFLASIANATSGAAGEGGIAFLSHIAGFITGLVWTILILRRRFFERHNEY
ncbi:rhomboid family intramembrane serine protease [Candidatus Latescibacterota bacterium]